MSLKFLSGSPLDAQLQSSFANLSTLSAEQITELAALCLQSISSPGDHIEEKAREFGQANRINFKTLDPLINSFTYFFAEAVKRSMKHTEVLDDLVSLAFEYPAAQSIANVYREHFATLSFAALDATLKVSNLVDMEWKFGVTAGTSDLTETGTCFLQLKLVLEKGGKRNNVLMEITLEQFYSFLSSLQKASAALDVV